VWSERQIIVITSFSIYQSQSSFGGGLIGFDRQRRKSPVIGRVQVSKAASLLAKRLNMIGSCL